MADKDFIVKNGLKVLGPSITVNGSDDVLDRANHTGTQVAATISDFDEAVEDRVGAALVAGTSMAVSYDDAAGTITLSVDDTISSGNGDVTNITDTNEFFSTSGNANRPNDLELSEDGTKMIVLDSGPSELHEFTLSTPFDVLTASWVQMKDISQESNGAVGLGSNNDGTRLFVGYGTDKVRQMNLSAWNLSSFVKSTIFDVSPQVGADLKGLAVGNNAARLYVASTNDIYSYTMSTPGDLSTATYDGIGEDFSSEVPSGGIADLFISDDGTQFIVYANLELFEYELSTPFDISSRTLLRSKNITGFTSDTPDGFTIAHDRSKIYFCGDLMDGIEQSDFGGGSAQGIDAATLEGNLASDLLDRANHTGTQLSSTLSDKADLLDRANHTGTQTASTISDFDTEVSNNTDVAANTAKLTADETNVVAALDGATLTAVTVDGADKVLVQDASDVDNIKTVTAQSIADLATAGHSVSDEGTVVLAAPTDVNFTGAGVTVTDDTDGTVTVDIPGSSGGFPDIHDEGLQVQESAGIINFIGPNVTAAADGTGGADITIDADGGDASFLGGQSSSWHVSRDNHTGTQLASTISDFGESVDDRVNSLLVGGTAITLSYNDAGNTLTINGENISNTKHTFTKQQNFGAATLTPSAGINWNLDNEQVAVLTLDQNGVLNNPTNKVNGGTYVVIVKQDATGGRTLSYGTDYKWPGGTAPTLSTGANAVDILTFVSDGTNMYGSVEYGFA